MRFLRMVEFNTRAVHLIDEDNIGRVTVQLRHDQVYPVALSSQSTVDRVDGIWVVTLERYQLRVIDVIFAVFLLNARDVDSYNFCISEANLKELFLYNRGLIDG